MEKALKSKDLAFREQALPSLTSMQGLLELPVAPSQGEKLCINLSCMSEDTQHLYTLANQQCY